MGYVITQCRETPCLRIVRDDRLGAWRPHACWELLEIIHHNLPPKMLLRMASPCVSAGTESFGYPTIPETIWRTWRHQSSSCMWCTKGHRPWNSMFHRKIGNVSPPRPLALILSEGSHVKAVCQGTRTRYPRPSKLLLMLSNVLTSDVSHHRAYTSASSSVCRACPLPNRFVNDESLKNPSGSSRPGPVLTVARIRSNNLQHGYETAGKSPV